MWISLKTCIFSVSIAPAVFVLEPSQISAQTPEPVEQEFVIADVCQFPVLVQLTGKAKTLELPGGRLLLTSPGLKATLTNQDHPGNTKVFNITGTFHQTTLANGNIETVSTGNSLLIDPFAGFAYVSGKWSYIFDAQGNLVQPLTGNGAQINVCEVLG